MTSAKGLYDRKPFHETILGRVSYRLTQKTLATKGETGRAISKTLEQDALKRESNARSSPENAQMREYLARIKKKAMDNIG